jgi:hypothetical protein
MRVGITLSASLRLDSLRSLGSTPADLVFATRRGELASLVTGRASTAPRRELGRVLEPGRARVGLRPGDSLARD